MAIVKTGQGVSSIIGSLGGVYFTRDTSGLHCAAKPRRVRHCSPAQAKQRNAFSKARAYSTNNRTVSYNIYRALNDLPMAEPPIDYQPPHIKETTVDV